MIDDCVYSQTMIKSMSPESGYMRMRYHSWNTLACLFLLPLSHLHV